MHPDKSPKLIRQCAGFGLALSTNRKSARVPGLVEDVRRLLSQDLDVLARQRGDDKAKHQRPVSSHKDQSGGAAFRSEPRDSFLRGLCAIQVRHPLTLFHMPLACLAFPNSCTQIRCSYVYTPMVCTSGHCHASTLHGNPHNPKPPYLLALSSVELSRYLTGLPAVTKHSWQYGPWQLPNPMASPASLLRSQFNRLPSLPSSGSNIRS